MKNIAYLISSYIFFLLKEQFYFNLNLNLNVFNVQVKGRTFLKMYYSLRKKKSKTALF